MKGRRPISLVVAMARNGVIGDANTLPWHLPADLRHFRETTMGRPIVMGRRTAESIGRALPGRDNLVVTHRPETLSIAGMRPFPSLEAALAACPDSEIMIIGGASLYAQALPIADRIHRTLIDAEIPGDTRFPSFDEEQWRLVEREPHAADAANPYPYTFELLVRRREAPSS